MGYIGKIRAVIIAEDMDELGEAVTEVVPAPAEAAAVPETVPA